MDDRNGVIISYSVKIVEVASDQTVITENVTERTFTQQNLSAYTNYSVKIRASTSVGTGPPSSTIIRTDQAGI